MKNISSQFRFEKYLEQINLVMWPVIAKYPNESPSVIGPWPVESVGAIFEFETNNFSKKNHRLLKKKLKSMSILLLWWVNIILIVVNIIHISIFI